MTRRLYGLELGSSGRGGVTYKPCLGKDAIGFFVVFFGIGFFSLRIFAFMDKDLDESW